MTLFSKSQSFARKVYKECVNDVYLNGYYSYHTSINNRTAMKVNYYVHKCTHMSCPSTSSLELALYDHDHSDAVYSGSLNVFVAESPF